MSGNEDSGGFGAVTETPGIGHNIPPNEFRLPTTDLLRALLRERHAELLKKAIDLVDSEKRIPRNAKGDLDCPDEAWEKKLSDVVRLIQGTHKSLDTARTSEKQVYDDLVNAVHGLFRERMDALVDPNASRTRPDQMLKGRIERAITAYKVRVQEEARRKANEEADRRRIEEEAQRKVQRDAEAEAQRLADEAARKRKPENKAAAEGAAQAAANTAAEAAARANTAGEQRAQAEAVASAPAADLTRTRGSLSMSSLKEFLDFRDIEYSRLPAITLWAYVGADAKEKAVRAYMNANADPIKAGLKNGAQPLAGCTFFINHSTTVR